MRRVSQHRAHPVVATLSVVAIAALLALSESALAAPTSDGVVLSATDHVVISELMTGGASASDEFIELYNPGTAPLSLDGMELVYVTASGATITRKAVWGPAEVILPGAHKLVANEAGLFAGIADLTYANGLAATGGSMALRVVSASTAVDVVGWGTAASSWLEGNPAPAPAAGSSLERLPGGALGSAQDTANNVVDFEVRDTPDPQNSASPPVPTSPPSAPPSASVSVAPSSSPASSDSPMPTLDSTPAETPAATPDTTPTATPIPTPSPEPTATPSPGPGTPPMTIAEARAMPDDATVVVAGVTLTDSAFSEGGGYLTDPTGGIAILLAEASFPRGVEAIVSGTVDDRFAQRTIRADAAGVQLIGPAADPIPMPADTGSIGDSLEGRLVVFDGVIDGAPTSLSAGIAFDVDDGSGAVRVLVGPATGIDTSAWVTGATLSIVGVVGQRDSSGTGTEGYRVQPRDAADVLAVQPPATQEPSVAPSLSPTPSPGPSAAPVMTIAAARAAAVGAPVRIRGVVTLPTGLVESGSAVVADPSGAILVRANADGIRLRRGQLVELVGTRSTRSGMASIRVTKPAAILGTQADPEAPRRATGQIREADEALLVVVRGLIGDGPRRTSGGAVTLTLNDGSGALRVFVAEGTSISAATLPTGSWVEIRGVVGQLTTGSAPTAGYRLWPRDRADITLIARAPAEGRLTGTSQAATGSSPSAQLGPTTAPPLTVQPHLGGAIVLADAPAGGATVVPTPPPAELQAPLALGLGGLAGLATLAWRHGTWRRVGVEAKEGVARLGTLRTAAQGEKEDESYTLAP